METKLKGTRGGSTKKRILTIIMIIYKSFMTHQSLLQITCFKESKNMAAEKNLRVTKNFYKKTISSSYLIE